MILHCDYCNQDKPDDDFVIYQCGHGLCRDCDRLGRWHPVRVPLIINLIYAYIKDNHITCYEDLESYSRLHQPEWFDTLNSNLFVRRKAINLINSNVLG